MCRISIATETLDSASNRLVGKVQGRFPLNSSLTYPLPVTRIPTHTHCTKLILLQLLSAKPVIYMVNIAERDYLRSLATASNASGRENFRVRAVMDEVYAYESRAYGLASTTAGATVTSASGIHSSNSVFESDPKSKMGTVKDPGTMSEPINTTSAVLGSLSNLGSESMLAQEDTLELADDVSDSSVVDVNETAFRPFPGTLKMGEIDDNLSVGIVEIRTSLVICCSVAFEEVLSKRSRQAVGQHHLSSREEYTTCNPSHKSILTGLVDALYKTLGTVPHLQ